MFSFYPKRFANHILLPLNFSEMPEILEITRCLSTKKTEAMGKVVLFLEMQRRPFQKKIPISKMNAVFGKSFCDALIKVGWGYRDATDFYFKAPENILSKPGRSIGGTANAMRALRDKRGRFTKKNIPKMPVRKQVDSEGNIIS